MNSLLTVEEVSKVLRFIELKGGDKDFFFHKSEAASFDDLKEGDMVTFEIGEGKRGDKVAVRVTKMVTEEER